MKNIPHQLNDLRKIREALEVFRDLQSRGEDLSDDGVVGRQMALDGVYGFRDKDLSVEEALQREASKPRASQGTRTFARDLRRLFELLGFLDAGPPPTVSPAGEAFLASVTGSQEEKASLRTALDAMVLGESGSTSHPYRILLRLAREVPGITTAKLALALEAADDSDAEFERVRQMANSPDWWDGLVASGVSEHMLRNAVKILPPLARQIGDLHTAPDGRNYYNRAVPVAHAARPGEASRGEATARPRRRLVTAETIAAAPSPDEGGGDPGEAADPAHAAAIRLARLQRHNTIVRAFARVLEQGGFQLTEAPYDVLGEHDAVAVLGEAKTLDGDAEDDERVQIRRAVGQLLYYEYFELRSEGRRLCVCILEREPSAEHQAFLETLNILPCWIENDGLTGPDWVLAAFADIGITLRA